MGWEVHPEALYEVLKWLQDDYGNPKVVITENGAAFDDRLADGVVDDPKRIAYLEAHLAQVKRAMDEGANINGYFVWSLMDNFEWATGYSKRFGLIYVDYETQQRTIKNSGKWYAELIRRNRA
jgi:beta-glucosidase